MPILNYTTKVDAHKTLAEIQRRLVAKGAQSVSVDYEPNGTPSAVTFMIPVNEKPIHFRLPSNYQGVEKAMQRAKGVPYRLQTREQAVRVCWRILKDWIEAQMAIIEAGQAQLSEVFLAYALNDKGQTLFQFFNDNPSLLTDGASQSQLKLLNAINPESEAVEGEIIESDLQT